MLDKSAIDMYSGSNNILLRCNLAWTGKALESAGKMSAVEQKEVVASLEGMRVTVDGKYGQLHEYDFEKNKWDGLESARLPLCEPEINRWLGGWNRVDRFTAFILLSQQPGPMGDSENA